MTMKKAVLAALSAGAIVAVAASGASAQFMTGTESSPGSSVSAPGAAGGASKAAPAKKAAKKSAKKS
jgi:hypothetical protein